MGRAVILALLLAAAAATAAPPQSIVFEGASVIEGTGAPLRPNMVIVVKGERIEAIVPVARFRRLPGMRVEDASGLFALPGLIDSHVHLASPPDRRFAEAVLRRDLYSGVTAVRDMAGDARALADWSRAARIGEIVAPDIYYAALMAGLDFFADPRTVESTKGAIAGQVPWMRGVTPETNLPLAIAEAHGTGATGLKIYADLPGPLVADITAEAHRQHMLVWAHAAVFPASPSEVIGAGVDVVSHSCLLAYQASAKMPPAYHNRAPVEEDKFASGNSAVAQLFDEMKRRGTILDATLWVYDVMWKVPNASPKPYCSRALAEKLAAEAHRAGVEISAGTDSEAPWRERYPALFHELPLLVHAAGLTPAEALRASSLVGARTIGQEREMGTLEADKLANIVFTAKNPLEDIDNLQSVTMTVKRGHLYRRSDYRPIVKEEVQGEN
jgi:imidazolonepropionase-like amidohydrolase